jgi:hypothetical protein
MVQFISVVLGAVLSRDASLIVNQISTRRRLPSYGSIKFMKKSLVFCLVMLFSASAFAAPRHHHHHHHHHHGAAHPA